ncbi:MAG: hypothetical protein AAF211_27470 [Myxococcota bacterium]
MRLGLLWFVAGNAMGKTPTEIIDEMDDIWGEEPPPPPVVVSVYGPEVAPDFPVDERRPHDGYGRAQRRRARRRRADRAR